MAAQGISLDASQHENETKPREKIIYDDTRKESGRLNITLAYDPLQGPYARSKHFKARAAAVQEDTGVRQCVKDMAKVLGYHYRFILKFFGNDLGNLVCHSSISKL